MRKKKKITLIILRAITMWTIIKYSNNNKINIELIKQKIYFVLLTYCKQDSLRSLRLFGIKI